MTDKKNIVIKIKRPTLPPENEIQGVTVTQWHLPRIMMAVAVLLVVIGGLLYFFFGKSSEDGRHLAAPVHNLNSEPVAELAEEVQTQSITKADNQPQADTGDDVKHDDRIPEQPKPADSARRVRRALLASTIVGKEPGDVLESPIVASDVHPITVYYFTELRGMDGETVYHEWLQNGKAVYRHQHEIAAQRWRTTSHRLMDTNAAGDWQVKTTDSQGRLLNELFFKVN